MSNVISFQPKEDLKARFIEASGVFKHATVGGYGISWFIEFALSSPAFQQEVLRDMASVFFKDVPLANSTIDYFCTQLQVKIENACSSLTERSVETRSRDAVITEYHAQVEKISSYAADFLQNIKTDNYADAPVIGTVFPDPRNA